MKIFINEKNEIKAINASDNKLLLEVEVDRDEVFGTMSDFKILHYCINGLETYPAIDTELLDKLETDYLISEQSKKIDILQSEKDKLLQITKEQDKLLVDNTYKISMLEMNLGGI